MKQNITFIGGGNMGRALIGGLIARQVDPRRITVADPYPPTLQSLQQAYQVRTTSDNDDAVSAADVVVLAVKPQQLREVVQGIAPHLRSPVMLISVAAGIRAEDIQRWAGGAAVVRCMPNRPALEGCGVSALYATSAASDDQRALAEQIMKAVGTTLWLTREADMDAVTAVSGSGPAYFFLLMEILAEAGQSLGLSADTSRELAVQTAYGAGFMARQSADTPATLREQVTSKGGTTAAALNHMEANDIRRIIGEAVAAAAHRSAELADQLGDQAPPG